MQKSELEKEIHFKHKSIMQNSMYQKKIMFQSVF